MRLIVFLIACLLASVSFSRQIVLVIDAGHGGKDVGHETPFSGHQDEKHLNLKIAEFLGGYINKYLQNVKVVYTRSNDRFVSLDNRVDIANGARADYFISIHCNGNERKSVRGTESHVHELGLKKSLSLAKMIEKQFSSRAGRKSRGVKDKNDLQHSLQVLKFTQMTSVLVECGFVTNQKEANFLNSTYGQEIMASAIFRAFRGFIQEQHPNTTFVKSASDQITASTPSSDNRFTIQIMSSKEPVKENDSYFKKLDNPVTRKKLNTTSAYKYIYTVGNYSSRKEAKSALPKIQGRGFKDAIIVRK